MIISVSKLARLWNVAPDGVIHVGAHLGEEAEAYEKNQWFPVLWIEAQEELVIKLQGSLDNKKHSIINAAISNKDDEVLEFKVSSNGQSSSLLNFGTHKKNYPDTVLSETVRVTTSTLSKIMRGRSGFNFINLDIQGVELQALEGYQDRLAEIDWIYTEVNYEEVYQHCTQIEDLDTFLEKMDFKRVSTRWCLGLGWGDALYARKLEYSKKQRLLQCYDGLQWYLVEITKYPVRLIRRRLQA